MLMLGSAYIARGEIAEGNFAGQAFSPRELGRVGVAATMIAFGGTVIVLLMLMLLGHYSSLSHCGPKAVLDGAVIALLIGQRGRWRCLALLGVVYGLVLLIQVGVAYLPVVLTTAGLVGAGIGVILGTVHRRLGVLLAAAMFELCAGLGAPLKIYFGTADAREPFLWGLWFAEWPLRVIGAWIGVWLAWRWVSRREVVIEEEQLPLVHRGGEASRGAWRVYGVRAAGLRLVVLLLATTVPLAMESWEGLLAVNGLMLIYAMVLGPGRAVTGAVLGVVWGYAVFAGASYLWHQDIERVIDLVRTFGLRFGPMAMASVVLICCVRPVDLLRALRVARLPGVVLLPLAVVLRQIPHTRRDVAHRIERLRRSGHWTGPTSMLRHPRTVLTELLVRPLQRWAGELAE